MLQSGAALINTTVAAQKSSETMSPEPVFNVRDRHSPNVRC